jgi:hypothetical protein
MASLRLPSACIHLNRIDDYLVNGISWRHQYLLPVKSEAAGARTPASVRMLA